MIRLWWKEALQFWPIWVVLVVTAAALEWLALRYGPPGLREGALYPLAVAWASLYAVAVGAAAFAGEREAGTLALLDAMPVSRPLLWGGKVSFALVTTALLTLGLVGLAALGSQAPGSRPFGPGAP